MHRSQRTENFHAQIFAVAGRQGTPSEGLRYNLTTGEMIRVALAWSDKLTPAQISDLNALLARTPNPTALEADAALFRGSAVRPGGTQRVPSSQAVAGEITRRSSTGGGGGVVEPSSVPEPRVGLPDMPVVGPAARGQAKGAFAEFGAQALLAKQLGNVGSAELAKAEARFQELAPEIERLLQEGYSVTVTLEAEVPKTVNIAGAITDTDPTLVVYFRKMYIKRAMKVPRALPAGEVRQTSVSAVGEVREGFGDPNRWDDPHELTLNQQIR